MRKKLVLGALALTAVGAVVHQVSSISKAAVRGINEGMSNSPAGKRKMFKGRSSAGKQQEVSQVIRDLNQ